MPRQTKSPTPKRQTADAAKRTATPRPANRSGRKPREGAEHHDTLAPTVEAINENLARARQALRGLPKSDGRTGLQGLTEFLARQTEALGVCA